MGRKRKSRTLNVFVGTSLVGVYALSSTGATSFRYDAGWLASDRAFPISMSLPLSDRVWSGEVIASVFDGLLPDDRAVRMAIAAREGAESAGTFDILAAIGRDCVGALRFVPEGEDPGNPAMMSSRPISDEEISARLAGLAVAPLGMARHEEAEDFRISIAGMQEKTAFLWANDCWQLPIGSTPTSHIFKPAPSRGPNGADFSDLPWNECLCLAMCSAFGIATASSDVVEFGGRPVFIVERFDRRWRDGVLYRLPQEDLCQAMGVSPSLKYESDGGPGVLAILEFLRRSADPRADRLTFFKTQIVFWLLAAIDGHAKNFSIALTPGGFGLTPLYDVVSAAPYPELPMQKIKLAMAVGDRRHYRLREVTPRHFRQTAAAAGLAGGDVEDVFRDLAARVGVAAETAAALSARLEVPQRMSQAIIEGMEARGRLLAS